MSPVDRFSPLIAQIRAQAIAWTRKAQAPDAPRGAPGQARAGDAATSGRAPAGSADWLAQVALAVRSIQPDDPQRRRKAFRAYLQALLARECGISDVEDGEFQQLVDRVLETMEADDRLRDALTTAGDSILQSATAA